jgi:hypothetical protein
MCRAVVEVIHAVVQLDRFVPVVLTGLRLKNIVSGSFGRTFVVWTGNIKRWLVALGNYKIMVWDIVKIVVRAESDRIVIVLSKILDSQSPCVGMVLPCHVIWNKINNSFQIVLMRPFQKLLKLLHAVRNIHRQVRVDVIVIFDRIRGAGNSFNDQWMVGSDAVLAVIAQRRMFQDARVPHVCDAEIFQCREGSIINVIEFPGSVVLNGTIKFIGTVQIAEQSGKNLVYDEFIFVGK